MEGKKPVSGADTEEEPDVFMEFLHEFHKESDRAAVILGAAKIDLILYQILQRYLVAIPGSKDELLDGDAPLGTFSAKINVMYRLGILDAEYTRALHLIRRIRNDFAHELAGGSLNSGAHRDRVKELVAPFKESHWFKKLTKSSKKMTSFLGSSLDFRVMLGMIIGELEVVHKHCSSLTSEAAQPLLVITRKPQDGHKKEEGGTEGTSS